MIRKPVLLLILLAALNFPFPGHGAEPGEPARIADAARNRDMVTVRSLLKGGVDASVVNAFGYDGSAALHCVVLVDDIDTANLLLAAGADAKLANRLGVMPLAIASTNGNEEMIRLLIKSGADPNALDSVGEPPLWAAVRSGSLNAVTALVDNNASLVFKDSAQQTTLMLAVREDHPDIVKFLVDKGADAYTAPSGLVQDTRCDGLPIGTRGGMPIHYTFPLDAEYQFATGDGGPGGGRGGGGGTDITLDGQPLTIRGNQRIKVAAGPHVIAMAVIEGRKAGGIDDAYSDFRVMT